jgi:histidinol phosphatase-like enzyme
MSLFQRNLEEHLYLFKEISILDNDIQKAIDPLSSVMVGGKVSDIVAATNAGIKTSYFVSNRTEERLEGESNFIFNSLSECVKRIIHANSSGLQ